MSNSVEALKIGIRRITEFSRLVLLLMVHSLYKNQQKAFYESLVASHRHRKKEEEEEEEEELDSFADL